MFFERLTAGGAGSVLLPAFTRNTSNRVVGTGTFNSPSLSDNSTVRATDTVIVTGICDDASASSIGIAGFTMARVAGSASVAFLGYRPYGGLPTTRSFSGIASNTRIMFDWNILRGVDVSSFEMSYNDTTDPDTLATPALTGTRGKFVQLHLLKFKNLLFPAPVFDRLSFNQQRDVQSSQTLTAPFPAAFDWRRRSRTNLTSVESVSLSISGGTGDNISGALWVTADPA